MRRFGEFQKSLGTARNILTARLRKLVDRGVLERVSASDGSAYQEYVLTEKGRGLDVVLVALRQWGESCLFEPGELCRARGDGKRKRGTQAAEPRPKEERFLRSATLRVMSDTGSRG